MKSLKQKIQEYLETPYQIGENVEIFKNGYSSDYLKLDSIDKNKIETGWFEILAIDDNIFTLKSSYNSNNIKCVKEFISSKVTYHIGVNPFPKKNWQSDIRFTNKDLQSVLYTIGWDRTTGFKQDYFDKHGVDLINWNPFVIDKEGKKVYYQRGFVWNLNDNQLLIESIINGIEIGKFVIRKRSIDLINNEIKLNGKTELCFADIVDGKQRLNAILEFVNSIYPDIRGDYFKDYSKKAKNEFMNFMGFSFGEMQENCDDEAVIRTFLNINFTGVPMSQEHINFVKSINI